MADVYHYPPDIFELLIETIPRLVRAKKGVVLFLKGAGVAQEDLNEVERQVATDPDGINKFDIVRRVLVKLNARGDSGLRPRREIIKRVVEFESFETCWPQDQLKAKGLVATLRQAVDTKDSFTRMKQERDAEHVQTVARQRAQQASEVEKRRKLSGISERLSALFGMDDRPQERGKQLEAVLNDLFRAYGILVREDFRRKDPDTGLVLEQVDGVIELDSAIQLVEMKWLNQPVGVAEFSPHLVRLFGRANASGIFISTSGYTEAVIKQCTEVLGQKTMALCTLQELVMLLHRQDDLPRLLKRKLQAAIIDKNPFVEILS